MMIELWAWNGVTQKWDLALIGADCLEFRQMIVLRWLELRRHGLCTYATKGVITPEAHKYREVIAEVQPPAWNSYHPKSFPVPMPRGGFNA